MRKVVSHCPRPQENCLPLVLPHVRRDSIRTGMVSSVLEEMSILGFRIPRGDACSHQ